jgi:hypothetical protein
MALELNGTTGVSLVQDGVITDANLPAGSVLQVVQGSSATAVTASSTTPVSTGLSVSITPSSASSKILVFANCSDIDNQAAGRTMVVRLFRDSTDVASGTYSLATFADTGSRSIIPCSISFLDSPSTTSATTYEVYINSRTSDNVIFNSQSGTAVIIAMEIAG